MELILWWLGSVAFGSHFHQVPTPIDLAPAPSHAASGVIVMCILVQFVYDTDPFQLSRLQFEPLFWFEYLTASFEAQAVRVAFLDSIGNG